LLSAISPRENHALEAELHCQRPEICYNPAPVKNLLIAVALACLAFFGQSLRAQNIVNSNNTIVRFEIRTGGATFGTLDIELFDQEKPETVRNFLLYVYTGAYSNLALHRVIPNFVAQGGRVLIPNEASTDPFSTYLSGYNYGRVTNEYSVGPELSNQYGTIAMARIGGEADSASAEFFFNLTNNAVLDTIDGGFTVFGHVVNTSGPRSGTNLLNYFNTFSAGHGIGNAFIFDRFEFFSDLAVSTNRPTVAYADLFTVRASLIPRPGRERTPPTVSILDPSEEIRTTNGTVTFSGTASDNMQVTHVFFDTPQGRFFASGKENWTKELELRPGTNRVTVHSLDSSGNLSLPATRKVFYSVPRAVTLQVQGKGKVTGITDGQVLEAGVTYKLVATPPRGHYFLGWRGSVSSNERTYFFTMREDTTNIVAVFSRTLLGLTTGTYQGLFLSDANAPSRSAGFITLNLSARGEYYGRLTPLGSTLVIHGKFGTNGTSVITGQRGSDPLGLELTLYPGSDAMVGTFVQGQTASSVLLFRAEKFGATNPAPVSGQYTYTISPTSDPDSSVADGSGFGTVTIDERGRIKMSGMLADETAVRQNALVLKGNRWPIFAPAYRGRGGILGWATFDSNNVFNADVAWFAPNLPGGTNQQVHLSGSPYTPPSQARLFDWTNGVITLTGGDLSNPITANALLNEDGSFTVLSGTNNIQLSVSDATGLLTGSFTHPVSNATTPLKGAVLQSSNNAAGYFPGTPRDGALLIQREP
jgi:cyclophilin family peptidyl-prolyl cis-trans isomerase